MSEKIKNIAIALIIIGMLVALLIYAFNMSDFSNLNKKTTSGNDKIKAKAAKKRYFNMEVEVDNGLINLGDFEINIGNGQKLITNISAKYDDPSGWGLSSGVEGELRSKGDILRHATIEAIMNQKESDVRSYRVKTAIIDNMNSHISSTKVEEIYFNKLIVAE